MHHRDRKRIVRLLIEDVTLIKNDPVTVHIRFKGGKKTTLTIPLPQQAYKTWQTPLEVINQIDMLLDKYTLNPIASILNEQGLRSGKGKPFNTAIIGNICRDYNLRTRFDRLREKGLFTVKEMAVKLGTSTTTIKVWRRNGWLNGHVYNDKNECLFEDPGTGRPFKYQRVKPSEQRLKFGFTPDHTKEVQYEA